MTENIATFGEQHVKHIIATTHDTYTQDTLDFLTAIHTLNKGPKLNPNSLLETMDAIALFTNIIHNEGPKSMNAKLEKRETKKVPSDYIIKLMEVILKHNIYEFHEAHWRQEVGAAIGSKPVPGYANMFIA